MENKPLFIVPRFNFNKGAHLDAEQENRIVEDTRKRVKYSSELALPISPERTQAIELLIRNQIEWAQERLGISLEDRMPQLEKIRYYSPEDYQQVIGRGTGLHSSPSNEIDLAETPHEAQTLANTAHELAHQFSRQALRVGKLPDGRTEVRSWLYGYKTSKYKQFDQFNEVAVEMANFEQLQRLYNSVGVDLLHAVRGHYPSLIYLDMIFEQAVQQIGMDRFDFQTQLYKGLYRGDYIVLRTLHQAIGTTGLKHLAKMPVEWEVDNETKQILSETVGIDNEEYQQKLITYENGSPIIILHDIPVYTNLKR